MKKMFFPKKSRNIIMYFEVSLLILFVLGSSVKNYSANLSIQVAFVLLFIFYSYFSGFCFVFASFMSKYYDIILFSCFLFICLKFSLELFIEYPYIEKDSSEQIHKLSLESSFKFFWIFLTILTLSIGLRRIGKNLAFRTMEKNTRHF